MSRRVVLAALAAAAGTALAGCTEDGQPPRPKAQPSPVVASVDPDVAVAAEALASQQEMLDLLDATGKRHRDLSAQLAPVVATHQAHADLLADAVPKGVSVSPSPTTSPRSRGGRHEVPRSRARALAKVVEAEQQLATVTKRQAFRAESGAFARLLGSMAAAAAQSAAALVSAGGTGGTS
ncbi:MAG TPA: hypothetical protein VF012_07600 [Nocardioidaceae bacterium]